MVEFNRVNFFPIKKKIFSIDITKLINDFVIQYEIKDTFEILDISSIDYIKSNSILFLKQEFDLKDIDIDFLIIITDDEKTYNNLKFRNKVLIKNHNDVYNFLLNQLFLHEDCLDFLDEFIFKNGSHISKFAIVHESAIIQKNCIIERRGDRKKCINQT